MRYKILADNTPERSMMLVLDKGDEVLTQLREFAREQGITAARFSAIGAFSSCTLAFFERDQRAYRDMPIDEQVEVLSLTGSIGVIDGAPRVHAHAIIGMPDCSARGGHMVAGTVWPALEVSLVVSPGALNARIDDESGLPLLVP